jgi:hypothetical protein
MAVREPRKKLPHSLWFLPGMQSLTPPTVPKVISMRKLLKTRVFPVCGKRAFDQ